MVSTSVSQTGREGSNPFTCSKDLCGNLLLREYKSINKNALLVREHCVGVSEQADEADSKSATLGRMGSSPITGTKILNFRGGILWFISQVIPTQIFFVSQLNLFRSKRI